MRPRAKPPNLVSMWMLDVFCCALGCVTLLWLLNTRLAGDEAKRATVALADLNNTKNALLATTDDANTTRKLLNVEIDRLRALLMATTTEKTELATKLAVANTDIASTAAKLARSDATLVKTQDDLARKVKDAADLSTQLASAMQSSESLAKKLQTNEAMATALGNKVKSAEEKLTDVDAKLLALTRENVEAKSNLSVMKKTGDELTNAKSTIRDLQKKIDDTNAMIIDLQGDKAKLADKFDKLRIDSESRFAGIALTGKRVVFLVDTSGSMKLLDDKTPAPNKWATVAESVAKVMRSLPEMEKYQVVTFARGAKHLFIEKDWLPYQGEASIKKVQTALLTIEPLGDTNMHDAFDLAFKLKSDGLDTIYLFSDGLPTSGPGLSPEQEKTMTEAQRNEYLTRQMRTMLRTFWNPSERRRVRINSIGFFFESPEVGAFLWALSRENDGSFVGMSKP
ncbi:hypothetical protein BH11PLA2_BH11PLA2_05720 [soil metagenome]